jgi:hypothetical protein
MRGMLRDLSLPGTRSRTGVVRKWDLPYRDATFPERPFRSVPGLVGRGRVPLTEGCLSSPSSLLIRSPSVLDAGPRLVDRG